MDTFNKIKDKVSEVMSTEKVDPTLQQNSSGQRQTTAAELHPATRPTSTLPDKHRALIWKGSKSVAVETVDLPKYVDPRGQPLPHGVIVKVLLSNICGSDLHMYRGRANVVKGMPLGHEILGEIAEVGTDIINLKVGDLVVLPFNIGCGRCTNCKEQNTQYCLQVNPKIPGGAYGFADMGGWAGGQAEYCLVPYADFNCVKLGDRTKAMSKIQDLIFISDILPTGFHGAKMADVRVGQVVFISGAGPVGPCAAASAFLLGAGAVVITDREDDRLNAAAAMGCLTFNLKDIKDSSKISDKIKELTGREYVDCAIECVGYECCGCGTNTQKNVPDEAMNMCVLATKFGGRVSAPGIYMNMDPQAPNKNAAAGKPAWVWGEAWMRGITISCGQTPVLKYAEQLRDAIMWGRLSVAKYMDLKVISLDQAVDAYKTFDEGAWVKFSIAPHGTAGMNLPASVLTPLQKDKSVSLA